VYEPPVRHERFLYVISTAKAPPQVLTTTVFRALVRHGGDISSCFTKLRFFAVLFFFFDLKSRTRNLKDLQNKVLIQDATDNDRVCVVGAHLNRFQGRHQEDSRVAFTQIKVFDQHGGRRDQSSRHEEDPVEERRRKP